jgi:hypothetical protein
MKLFIGNQLTDAENCIDGVMFCMLASSAIDHVFKQVTFDEMIMMSALYKANTLAFHSASSLKKQPADSHVTLLGDIIQIPNQPVFTHKK